MSIVANVELGVRNQRAPLELRCSFSHVPWEQNSEADKLVNLDVGKPTIYFGYSLSI